MHHYSNRTSRSKLGASRLQPIFTEQIPMEATKHAFLMHGVLALTALHIACSEPAQRSKYASLCDKHQALALASYRHTLTHITDHVAHALFALATLLSISSLARANLRAYETPQPHHISVDSICEVLHLTRGVREVKEAAGGLINNGPFAVVLHGHERDSDVNVTLSPELMGVFRELDRMIFVQCADAKQRAYCTEAIYQLRDVYEATLGKIAAPRYEVEAGHVWRWTAILSYDFINLVHVGFPPALVIVAHFAVACNLLRDLWYVGPWGVFAFDGIRLALNGRLQEHMVWAQEQITTDSVGLKHGGAIVSTATDRGQDRRMATEI